MGEELPVWTVYDHPRDFPHCYVARKFLSARPTPEFIVSPDLASLREVLAYKGLIPLTRDPSDDPVILESWI